MGAAFGLGFTSVTAVCVQLGISWVALFLTGRIFDKFSGSYDSGVKEDALAALTIVLLTGVAGVLCSFLPIPRQLILLVYFGLIYYAFQLNGIIDLALFYFLDVTILVGLYCLVFLSDLLS